MFREHTENSLSRKKGNVDTDIVFEVMKSLLEKELFNKIILASGDGDYWRMINYLIKRNRFEKLLAPNHKYLSSLYRHGMSDTYITFLDDPSIKKKLELVRNTKPNKKAGSP